MSFVAGLKKLRKQASHGDIARKEKMVINLYFLWCNNDANDITSYCSCSLDFHNAEESREACDEAREAERLDRFESIQGETTFLGPHLRDKKL